MKGKKILVRGQCSGVFYGTLAGRRGREVWLTGCRRLWYWAGANSLSQLAADGPRLPAECKFTVTLPEVIILDAVELIPCSETAAQVIDSVPEWRWDAND